MLYTISHHTHYIYSESIQENVMEIRKQPMNTPYQRCLNFSLRLEPEVRVFRYHDHLGNQVHHFDVPWPHQELSILGESVVEVRSGPAEVQALDWSQLDLQIEQRDLYDMLSYSDLIFACPELDDLAKKLGLDPSQFGHPMALVQHLVQQLPKELHYQPARRPGLLSIAQVIAQGQGSAQDLSHVMLGLLRRSKIPCRYISGYRYDKEQPLQNSAHAWVEAYTQAGGWWGFDPSQGQGTDSSYVSNCAGRDLGDCPATRGFYRGQAQGRLSHSVQIRPAEHSLEEHLDLP